jgi:hypothetical protein
MMWRRIQAWLKAQTPPGEEVVLAAVLAGVLAAVITASLRYFFEAL